MIWGVSTSQCHPRGRAEFLPEVLTRTRWRKELSPCEKGQLSLHPSWKGGLDTLMFLGEGQRSQGMVTRWQDALTQFRKQTQPRAAVNPQGAQGIRYFPCMLSTDLKCFQN